jgi:hypothetical protein
MPPPNLPHLGGVLLVCHGHAMPATIILTRDILIGCCMQEVANSYHHIGRRKIFGKLLVLHLSSTTAFNQSNCCLSPASQATHI